MCGCISFEDQVPLSGGRADFAVEELTQRGDAEGQGGPRSGMTVQVHAPFALSPASEGLLKTEGLPRCGFSSCLLLCVSAPLRYPLLASVSADRLQAASFATETRPHSIALAVRGEKR